MRKYKQCSTDFCLYLELPLLKHSKKLKQEICHYPLQAAVEIIHCLKVHTHNFFVSYLLRTLVVVIAAMLSLVFLFLSAAPIVDQVYSSHNVIPCYIHGYKYECTGIDGTFYSSIIICGRHQAWVTGRMFNTHLCYRNYLRDLVSLLQHIQFHVASAPQCGETQQDHTKLQGKP